MGWMKEFKDFLKTYNVLGFAIAFIMGAAVVALVQSLVKDIVMPVITPFIPGGGWQTATLTLGKVVLGWGSFLGALINFIIIAFVVFFMMKLLLGKKKKA